MKRNESASEKRYKRLSKLIHACMDHFSEDEMIEVFNKITHKEYVEEKDSDTIIFDLSMAGYCIFKPDSIKKADQLKEFAETNIFPFVNEQQTCILF